MSRTYPALAWSDTYSAAHNRVCEVDIDASIATDWSIVLNGTDNNGDYVKANFAIIDNMLNPTALTVYSGQLRFSVSPYTRANVALGRHNDNMRLKADGGLIFLTFSERDLGIPAEQNQYGDSILAYLRSDGIVAMGANFDFGGFKGINLATPTLDTDAATKAYVDSGPSWGTAISASEAIGAGDFVNVYDNGGVPNVRLANAAIPARFANGYVTDAIANGASGTVKALGINKTKYAATAGMVYLSDVTPGGFTLVAPSADGSTIQPLGMSIPNMGIAFMPQAGVLI